MNLSQKYLIPFAGFLQKLVVFLQKKDTGLVVVLLFINFHFFDHFYLFDNLNRDLHLLDDLFNNRHLLNDLDRHLYFLNHLNLNLFDYLNLFDHLNLLDYLNHFDHLDLFDHLYRYLHLFDHNFLNYFLNYFFNNLNFYFLLLFDLVTLQNNGLELPLWLESIIFEMYDGLLLLE